MRDVGAWVDLTERCKVLYMLDGRRYHCLVQHPSDSYAQEQNKTILYEAFTHPLSLSLSLSLLFSLDAIDCSLLGIR